MKGYPKAELELPSGSFFRAMPMPMPMAMTAGQWSRQVKA